MIIGIDASRAVTPQRTGTEAYAYHLIQALLPLAVDHQHHIRLYFNQPPSVHSPLTQAHRQVEIILIPFPRLWTHLRLGWELYKRPPDIFFTPAHVIPLTYRRCSVATVHDVGYHHFPHAHPRSQLFYLRWSTRHNGRRSCRVLADSHITRTDLITYDHIPSSKIEVVYPGIDPNLKPVTDSQQLTAVQQKYGLTPPYLLYLSTLQPRKNLVRLIRAYAQAAVSHQLVLAGKVGWLAQPILDEIAQLPPETARHIILPGFIDERDKAALLSGATALLYPSLYEGFGFPALEAQACDTAVLCAATSSLPEIAGQSALLVDPLDVPALAAAIQRLTKDEALRQTLVQKGRDNVQRFDWHKTAVRLLTILEACAAG